MIAQPEIRCVEFVDEITEWMDGALSDEQRSLVEEHLSICPHCIRYLGQTRAAIRTVREARDPIEMPAAMRDALLAAMRDRAR